MRLFGWKRCMAPLFFVLGSLAIAPAITSAAVVTANGSALTFDAAPGETNNVTVTTLTGTTRFTFTDSANTVTTNAASCGQDDPHTVSCDLSTVPSSITLALGDNDDIGTANAISVPIIGFGGTGNDTLTGGSGSDALSGGAGDDGLFGQGAADALAGGADNDTLEGGQGSDAGAIGGLTGLDGGTGDDVVSGGPGDDQLIGGADTDMVTFEGASGVTASLTTGTATGDGTDTLTGFEDLTGSNSADTLTGTSGANTISGLFGNDTLVGLAGDDQLIGGDDVDTASYAGEPATVATLDQTAVNVNGTDSLVFVENLIGSAFDDTLAGDEFANTLDGGSGGSDTVTYAGSSERIIANLTTDDVAVENQPNDSIPNVENLITSPAVGLDHITGDDGPNRITGLAGPNTFLAGGGDDVLIGGPDDDLLQGAAGDDTFVGGGGSHDTFDGGADTDLASLAGETGAWNVFLSSNASQSGGGRSISFSGIDSVIGSPQDDSISGTAGANDIAAGGGNDFVRGFGGDDHLDGGAGNNDRVSFQTGVPGVVANLATGTATGDGNDTLAGFEKLFGSDADDTLTGDAGNNVLSGLGGDDTLHGLGGNDDLGGGQGIDTVSYSTAAGPVTASLQADETDPGLDGDGGRDGFTDVERLTGSPFGDTLRSDVAAADVILGLGGADLIRVRDNQADTVDCGDGVDRVITDATDVALTGCETNDDPALLTAPAIVGSTPASGGADTAPKVKGTAPAGSTVQLYSTADCSGTALATGPATDFADAGLTVTVAQNATTTLRAQATSPLDGDGPSACSPPFDYTAVTPVTIPPVVPPVVPPVTPPTVPPVTPLDRTAPQTTLRAFAKTTTDTTPTLRFTASEAGSTFQCKVDKGAFTSCRSPRTLKKLKLGRHTFQVRAKDKAGNVDATPAKVTFTVKRKR